MKHIIAFGPYFSIEDVEKALDGMVSGQKDFLETVRLHFLMHGGFELSHWQVVPFARYPHITNYKIFAEFELWSRAEGSSSQVSLISYVDPADVHKHDTGIPGYEAQSQNAMLRLRAPGNRNQKFQDQADEDMHRYLENLEEGE